MMETDDDETDDENDEVKSEDESEDENNVVYKYLIYSCTFIQLLWNEDKTCGENIYVQLIYYNPNNADSFFGTSQIVAVCEQRR